MRVFILFLVLFTSYSNGESQDEVLLVVHDREITKDEFLYHFDKTDKEINQQNIGEYLELFIDMQLKLAQAREERVGRDIASINELVEYRLLLAAPYLSDREKEEELAREAQERLGFEVNVSHILFRLEANASPEDTLKMYAKVIQIRDRILAGESFEELALAFSDDPMVPTNSGNQGYITAFQTPYPFEIAAYNMKPGEISVPVRTKYGYHIIKLNDKRTVSGNMKTQEEVIRLIKVEKDERTQMIEDVFVKKLKKIWDFKENSEALDPICEMADERVYKGNWDAPENQSFDETIFFIDGKSVYQNQFIDFMQGFETSSRHLSIRDYIFSLYKKFVAARLIQYENYKLEEKYPEFRFQYQEYRDAMLLLEITRRNVWLKAESETAGRKLEENYDAVLADYQNHLMKKWIEDLRGKYNVEIYEEVLSSIK